MARLAQEVAPHSGWLYLKLSSRDSWLFAYRTTYSLTVIKQWMRPLGSQIVEYSFSFPSWGVFLVSIHLKPEQSSPVLNHSEAISLPTVWRSILLKWNDSVQLFLQDSWLSFDYALSRLCDCKYSNSPVLDMLRRQVCTWCLHLNLAFYVASSNKNQDLSLVDVVKG